MSAAPTMPAVLRAAVACLLMTGATAISALTTDFTTPQAGCVANCQCADVVDADSDGVPYDEYCNVESCGACSAACYYTDACCTDYLEYCDPNFRVMTQYGAQVGNCKGTSAVTLGRENVCFGPEDPIAGTEYEFDADTNCILGCARRAQEGTYSGFSVTWNGAIIQRDCPSSASQPTCLCSLITGTIGGVQYNSAYRCYTTATCSDGISNGEETGVDCGGIDCDACPCSDVDIDTICDDVDSCSRNAFNDADSDNFCAGDDAADNPGGTSTPPTPVNPWCAATAEDNYMGDDSLCGFSLGSFAQCSNDPLSEAAEVTSQDECHSLCANNENCRFFAVASSIGATGGDCFLYDECVVFPTLEYTEPLDIFYLLEDCFDNVKNQDEFTTDCSGICTPTCSHCFDGVMDYDELGTDCGGPTCEKLCLTFDAVGDGYCLGHTECGGSFCFETTDLDNADFECAHASGTYVTGDSCYRRASAWCEDAHGADVRGFSIDDAEIDNCDCAVKCYYTPDINTFVLDSFLSSPGGMECYAIATCSDGILNGDETDVDCGGDLCTATCDVDHDLVIDDDDSCVTDPENDIDGDQMCRDDDAEVCPYRWPDTTTVAPRMNGHSNGLPYCQFTPVGQYCRSKPVSDDALADYADAYATLYPLAYLPQDMQEICYQLCANEEECLFFSLVPGDGEVPLCYLHNACEYWPANRVNDSVSFSMVETCFDGVLNQNEETTDCGGVCEPTCACEGCFTHSFVALDEECVACETRVVYSDTAYNSTECGWLCAYLGSDCEAFDSRAGGDCHVMTNCGFYGTSFSATRERRRRRLHLLPPAKPAVPHGGKPVVEVDEKGDDATAAAVAVELLGDGDDSDFDDGTPAPAPSRQQQPDHSHVHVHLAEPSPSPAPRALLTNRRQLQTGTTTLGSTTDAPAPCNCCYQSYWKGQGPKASLEFNDAGGCRVCARDNCASKFKCYDRTGLASDIDWICWQTSTSSGHTGPGVLTTTPIAGGSTVTSPLQSTVATTLPVDVSSSAFIIDCGHGITASVGDGSECALLWADAVMLVSLVHAMVDDTTLVASLQNDFGTAVAAVTAAALQEDPDTAYFSDVNEDKYGTYNAVVEFELALTGITNDDLRVGAVQKDLRNAIADNCGLPANSPHIVINTARGPVMRGRALAAAEGYVAVGITLPIGDGVLTTSTPHSGACMLKEWCSDGVLNGDEEFVDCGGSCAACLPTCSDGETNGDEEDVDCGGNDCDPCPIDCVEAWSGYGSCSVTCGAGVKTRTWEVSTPANYGGDACTEEDGATETAACVSADLVVATCPVDCAGAWTRWGACSRSCGKLGVQTRSYVHNTDASAGGAECSIDAGTVATAACNTDTICPIDCIGEWGAWRCDATCGAAVGGTRTFDHSRRARFGGVDCAVADNVVEEAECGGDCCDLACDATVPPAVPTGVLWAVVSGGDSCRATGDYSAVIGGQMNQAKASYSAVAGGSRNLVTASYGFATGGRSNLVAGRFSVAGGGAENNVKARDAFAMGHDTLVTNCQQSTAVLGFQADTAEDSCTLDPTIQELNGCDSEGSAIQMCAETLTYNGQDIVDGLGGTVARHRALASVANSAGNSAGGDATAAKQQKLQQQQSAHDRVLEGLLELERRYARALRKVDIATGQAELLVEIGAAGNARPAPSTA